MSSEEACMEAVETVWDWTQGRNQKKLEKSDHAGLGGGQPQSCSALQCGYATFFCLLY